MLSTCSTRTRFDEDVVREGRDPPPAAPRLDQETDHSIEVVTRKAPSFGFPSGDGCPIDVLLKVWEHTGDDGGDACRV
jgi:hypothetical protein